MEIRWQVRATAHLSRPSARSIWHKTLAQKATQLSKKARKLFRHSHVEGRDGSNAPINYLIDEEHAAANKSL